MALGRTSPDQGVARGDPVPRNLWAAYLMLAGAPLFWAGNWVIARALVSYVTPLELTWARWVLAGAALLAFVRFREGQLPRLSSSHRAGVAAAAGLGMIAYTLLQYEALRYTQAINGTLIFTATPAFTLILAAIFLHERWNAAQLAGILLTLLGVAVIVSGGSPLALAGRVSVNVGDAMMLVASWAWAGYTVIARVLTRRMSAISLTACAMVMAAVALAPFQAWQWLAGGGGLPALFTPGLDAAGGPQPWVAAAALAYIGLLASAAAYLFWCEGVSRVGAGMASVFGNLLPVFTALLAVVFLGERLTTAHFAGAAAVMAGVYLAARPAPPRVDQGRKGRQHQLKRVVTVPR